MTAAIAETTTRRILNRVPEVTIWFWVIKILSTTVGETAADFLNEHFGLGLPKTTAIMGAVLVLALIAQFAMRRYVPAVYWTAVVLISIVGTLFSDNLVDNLGVALSTTTIIFGVALAVAFAVWYAMERSLSIHAITTWRREAFYWVVVLFTFSLGTAAGDLVSESYGIGYWKAILVFGALIAVVFGAWKARLIGAVPAFWVAYILTRPLGASMGDWTSQTTKHGGLGLGTTGTSVVFLVVILAVVSYLSVTRVDHTELVLDPA
jgi:uncharacterized membrane-anchored protein